MSMDPSLMNYLIVAHNKAMTYFQSNPSPDNQYVLGLISTMFPREQAFIIQTIMNRPNPGPADVEAVYRDWMSGLQVKFPMPRPGGIQMQQYPAQGYPQQFVSPNYPTAAPQFVSGYPTPTQQYPVPGYPQQNVYQGGYPSQQAGVYPPNNNPAIYGGAMAQSNPAYVPGAPSAPMGGGATVASGGVFVPPQAQAPVGHLSSPMIFGGGVNNAPPAPSVSSNNADRFISRKPEIPGASTPSTLTPTAEIGYSEPSLLGRTDVGAPLINGTCSTHRLSESRYADVYTGEIDIPITGMRQLKQLMCPVLNSNHEYFILVKGRTPVVIGNNRNEIVALICKLRNLLNAKIASTYSDHMKVLQLFREFFMILHNDIEKKNPAALDLQRFFVNEFNLRAAGGCLFSKGSGKFTIGDLDSVLEFIDTSTKNELARSWQQAGENYFRSFANMLVTSVFDPVMQTGDYTLLDTSADKPMNRQILTNLFPSLKVGNVSVNTAIYNLYETLITSSMTKELTSDTKSLKTQLDDKVVMLAPRVYITTSLAPGGGWIGGDYGAHSITRVVSKVSNFVEDMIYKYLHTLRRSDPRPMAVECELTSGISTYQFTAGIMISDYLYLDRCYRTTRF